MISSIVLSAGLSTRMGEPKALLDWGGQPLLAYQVSQLREAGVDEVIVVLGHRGDQIRSAVKYADCRFMLNSRYHTGRAGSLRIGAKASNHDADAIIVTNVDQPRPASFLRTLIEHFDPDNAGVQPRFGQHHGHPVLVAGRLREEMLAASDEDEGLHGILKRHAAELTDYEADERCHIDLNTPADYEAARKQFGIAV
jgi:CTP:molybdopterin cytidylyltransferase MocA